MAELIETEQGTEPGTEQRTEPGTEQRIVPNLWFDRKAAEAVSFYTSVFPASRTLATRHYPTEDLPDFQRDLAGEVLTVDFELDHFRFTAINAGPEFSFTPASSFMVNFDPSRDDRARAHLDELWAALSEGGQTLMPLGEYPFSTHYGWVRDRFGLTWQLILTDPEGEPRPVVVPNLMFGDGVQNRAREAIEFYTGLFPGSRTGTVAPYAEATGPATPGSIMFGEFTLNGQWFSAMDSGVVQPFTFTEAVSYSVTCDGQDEIDRLWASLSAVPEAEQCGWCKDRFGVSWQIVPANMEELMSRPGAYQKMLDMKKLEIAGF